MLNRSDAKDGARRIPVPALTFGGTATSAAGLLAVGAPWYVVAGVVGCGTLISFVQSVFPQESQHRLQWWLDRRQHRTTRLERDRQVTAIMITVEPSPAEYSPDAGHEAPAQGQSIEECLYLYRLERDEVTTGVPTGPPLRSPHPPADI